MSKQFTLAERERLAQLRDQDYTQAEIATDLGRSPSTIGREIKRNALDGEYRPATAQRLAQQRRSQRPYPRKCERPAVDKTIRQLLAHECSPDQIAQRMKQERPKRPEDFVSASTIYRWIEAQGEHRAHWREHLRRRGKRPYTPRKTPPDRAKARIAERPQSIEKRQRSGDFEGDLVLGKPGTGGVQTLVDRRSRYTLMMKVIRKEAAHVHRKTRERLRSLPEEQRRSITYDNGTEFAKCPLLAKSMGVKVYWAEPGCPYQRGTNENTNGLIRQYLPKGIDFRTISPARVSAVENLLNHRPRACLGYKTPHEVFHGITEKLCCD